MEVYLLFFVFVCLSDFQVKTYIESRIKRSDNRLLSNVYLSSVFNRSLSCRRANANGYRDDPYFQHEPRYVCHSQVKRISNEID